MCVCVCACGGDPPYDCYIDLSHTENYGEFDDISVGVTGTKPHHSWWVRAWNGNRFPQEFLDRRHMTAFLFANQTALTLTVSVMFLLRSRNSRGKRFPLPCTYILPRGVV